ncbi:hypothetical protein [Algibacter sp. R77976]|uniref:hypothetical protein n=1 Tax=Algibacter sp. R77976 TaxID=3093873 RepID=UPI0037C711BE
MKYLIPKSYRIRHKILEFLSNERMKNGGLNPPQEWKFTLKQICENINEDLKDVNIQSDYLFYKKLIHCSENESELTNPYCFATDDGITLFSSKSILNDGLLFGSSIFNNISTGFFQIIIAISTIISLWLTFSESNKLSDKVDKLEQSIKQTELNLKEPKLNCQSQNNSYDTKADYQTKPQIDEMDLTKAAQVQAEIKK